MPIISASVPHSFDPADVKDRATPHIEKMVDDFDGHDLDLVWSGNKGDFSFKVMAFTINGDVLVDEENITVNVDLPLMAMIFKDRVQEAIETNLSRAITDNGEEAEQDA